MESLKKLLRQLMAQLRDLSRSQRLAILLGGLLVAVSLIWMIQWAATPEMVPLLDQEFAPEDLARVQHGLELMNVPFKLAGHKVMVRADASPHVILARLQQQDSLPADTSVGFNALVKESNPWISQAEHERRWTVALKYELEQVLKQFGGVRSASVFLPMASGRARFARAEPAASASVTLIMEGGQPVSRELALAAARLVAGAVRGLSPLNVEVVDGNGVSALNWETETSGLSALERLRRKHEQETREKILRQLADPNARVGVQVELEHTDQSIESETPAKAVETRVETTNREMTRARPSGQPGVQPNVGLSAGGRLADEHTVEETSSTELRPGLTRKREATPPGRVKEVWAAINISRSYLESVYRQSYPDAPAATEEQIQQVFEREKPRVISQVTKLVKPQDEEHVAVDWYYDTALKEELAPRASALDETFRLVRQYGPQSGLALLALISLGMMLRLARRSDVAESLGLELGLPKEAIAAAQQAAKDVEQVSQQRRRKVALTGPGITEETLGGEPAAVGQAAITEGVLVAQEVDERTVQTNKMLEQISQVVEADPEAGSGLLEQWVQRSDSYKS